MRKDQRIEALIDLIRDDGPTIHYGIQAIREMQAKSAGREDEYLDVYVQVSAENDRLKEEIQTTKASMGFEECNRLREQRNELLAQRDNAHADVLLLQAERDAGPKITYLGRSARHWYDEAVRLRGLMSDAKKLIDQGSCDA